MHLVEQREANIILQQLSWCLWQEETLWSGDVLATALNNPLKKTWMGQLDRTKSASRRGREKEAEAAFEIP